MGINIYGESRTRTIPFSLHSLTVFVFVFNWKIFYMREIYNQSLHNTLSINASVLERRNVESTNKIVWIFKFLHIMFIRHIILSTFLHIVYGGA